MSDNRGGAPRAPAKARRRVSAIGVAVAAGALAVASEAEARTTGLTITSRTIAFGGYSFPGVGQYEVIRGVATGEVDPEDPRNAVIVDIKRAPKNANGAVEYSHNFYILKPLDMSRSNGKMMYEPPNRGRKTYQALNNTPAGNDDPAAIVDPAVLAKSFLWPQGYVTAWSGWEDIGPLDALPASAVLPVANSKKGVPITGPSYEYIVTNGLAPSFTLAYAASSPDKARAKLTQRVHLNDPPVVVPEGSWDYTDGTLTAIRLTSGNFAANDIYEFAYEAINPTVNGIGFAAIRDFNSFLRRAKAAENGTPNPIGAKIDRIYTEVSSQPGRTLNDFTYLGFNEDENGKKVFDGMMQWIAAGDGINMNYRWSQTKRTNRNRQDLLYLEGLFPFANQTTFDPISGTRDGRFKRCAKTRTCPLKIEFYSSNEYWVKTASLMHTDPQGLFDLVDHPDARLYLLSSKNHGGPGDPTSKGLCQQFQNPIDSAPVQRALFHSLDLWSTLGVEPPPSEVPKLKDGTLVPPLPQSAVGFPSIPGVTYTGLKTTRYRFDYGPKFYKTGVPTINPPVVSAPFEDNPANGPIYPSFVPRTDQDGNEISGIRLPEVSVPLATYTGWALRSGVWADDGCEGSGQYIPFARTQTEREASGDPRLSVEERYQSYGVYRRQVTTALDELVRGRFLLCDDAKAALPRLLQAGIAAGVPPPANPNGVPKLPECRGK